MFPDLRDPTGKAGSQDPTRQAGSAGSFGGPLVSGFHASAKRWQQVVRVLRLPNLDKWYLGGEGGGAGSLCPRHGPWLAKDKLSDFQFLRVFTCSGGGISRGSCLVMFRWFATHMSGVKISELS